MNLTKEQYKIVKQGVGPTNENGRCCGLDLGKDWDCFELCCPDEDSPDRCPKPATCMYDNGIERIPLCAEHYDAWCRSEAEPGDGTSPVWYEDGGAH